MTEAIRTGLYEHYKGNRYTVLFLAEHHETRAPQVVYLCHETRGLNVRPVHGTKDDPDGWLDKVNLSRGLVGPDGVPLEPKYVERFRYIGS